MTVLFSGHMDRCHCGHIATIQRLGQMFDRVIVVVLDYPESKFAIEHRVEVLQTILRNSKGNYEVCVNRDNFERIDKRKAATLMRGCNVYASGNPKCIARMKELGYETLPTERSWDYEAHLEK